MFLPEKIHDTFGLIHITALVVTLLLVGFGFYYAKKKLKIEQLTKVLFIIGIVSETVKVFSYIIANENKLGGYLPKTDLPFHLCSIQIILVLVLLLTKNNSLKRFLYSFMAPTCLFGGLMALLLPTSSSRNMLPITIQYFGYHGAIMIFALYLFFGLEDKFTIKDYLNSLKMLLLMLFIAIYVNSILYESAVVAAGESSINFMYVINPPMKGLPFLNKDHGWLVYIAHYSFLVLSIDTLCFISPIIQYFKSLRKKEK